MRSLVVLVISAIAASASAQDRGETRIDPSLEPYRAEIEFCFEREASLRPWTHGVVTIDATLMPDGATTDVTLRSSTFVDEDSVAARCLVSAVDRWTFDESPDETPRLRSFVLELLAPARAPAHIDAAPDPIVVTWRLTMPRGRGGLVGSLVVGDRAADELLAALERAHGDLRTCIVAEPDASRAGGGAIEILVRVPGGGDVGRDDVSAAAPSAVEGADDIIRCVGRIAQHFEIRSAAITVRYLLSLRWTIGGS